MTFGDWIGVCLLAALVGFIAGLIIGSLSMHLAWQKYCVEHKAGKWTVDEATGEVRFKLNGEK